MRKTSVLTACFLACFASVDIASAGAPTFFARRDYPDLSFLWVAVGDTNGDGIPDVIESIGGSMTVLLATAMAPSGRAPRPRPA